MVRAFAFVPTLRTALERLPFRRGLVKDESGSALVLLGLSLSALIGCAALGSEVAMWYVDKRTMQGAADSAALGAALVVTTGGDTAAQAKAIAATYGFVDQSNGTTVTVNNPPLSGHFAGNAAAVEVIVQRSETRRLSRLYLASAATLGARAVAIAGTGSACVLALSAGAKAATFGNGTTNVKLVKCGLVVNSNNSSALTLTGGAQITAESASITGGYSASGGAQLITTEEPVTGAPPLPDPYQDVALPPYSGCDRNGFKATSGTNVTLDPGVYCNGISLQGGSTVTLNPGVYVIDRGDLSVSGNATLSGNGVTIVLTSSSGTGYATVSISGGAVVNLSAPTTGSTAGLAFFQDRNAPSGVDNTFAGGSTMNIDGAIYLPKQTINFVGGTQTGGGCTQLVGDEIDFKGNATLESNCTGKGTKVITQPPRLVE